MSTIANLRYNQFLDNLSNAIDQRDAVPSQGVTNSGTATTSAMGSIGFSLTQPFAFAHNTKTFNPTASLNWQNNWGITPVSDPQDLQNLRALYGLLYRTDSEIAEFIQDTMKIQSASVNKPIDLDYIAKRWGPTLCGISLNPPRINNPNDAMEAYLNAMLAFPEYSVYKKAANKKPEILQSKCFGPVSTLGLVNDSLAYNYGLLYPTIHDVTVTLRNGLSPSCRHYQLANMFAYKENGIVRGDILFTRWLFWKAADGSWAPYNPPTVPEYLGKYADRDFWATSLACINDFILLAINATANSHAAAQNQPKTGPTPALQ
jgi:hypothetical protein